MIQEDLEQDWIDAGCPGKPCADCGLFDPCFLFNGHMLLCFQCSLGHFDDYEHVTITGERFDWGGYFGDWLKSDLRHPSHLP